MPHYEELYPGRFLKGVTLMQPKTIQIVSIGTDQLEGDTGKETKAILRYKDQKGEGEFVCCKTNSALIGAMHGPDFSKWPGKLVTIHFDPTVPFGQEKPGGIRVCGSPDLKETLRVEIKRPRRKKPDVHMLQPTGQQAPARGRTPTKEPAQRTKTEIAQDLAERLARIDKEMADRIWNVDDNDDRCIVELDAALRRMDPDYKSEVAPAPEQTQAA